MTRQTQYAPKWQSRIGFILATSGAAIGLGNIQRFPYMAAQNGGAAFLLLYLFCVVVIGLPLILVEFSIGRASGKNPVHAFMLPGKSKWWGSVGALGVLTAFLILTYYMVATGWTFGFAAMTLLSQPPVLNEFASEPARVLIFTLIIHIATTLIVSRGLNKGIEKFSKWIMPLLLILLLFLIGRAFTLEGASKGISYYLTPDFTKLNGGSFISALSQAFFSLCVGEAVLITYGGYTSKQENLVASASYIALFDTAIAFLAGLLIFPALFAFGEDPNQGVSLIYNVMPKIFLSMPFGNLLGAIFFLILSFAGLTTCVALLEIPASCVSQLFNWPKKKSVWMLSFISFCACIPAAFSQGASKWLSDLTIWHIPAKGYYELMDYLWGGLAMVVTGLLTTLFVGWQWGTTAAINEINLGSPQFSRFSSLWGFHIKWIAPLLIVAILFSLIFM